MVCSVDHLASSAGLTMLRNGGSAADAAIATSAVLAVTFQHACRMGGEFGDGLLALGGGEYTKEDLARSQADWVDPLSVQAFDHGIWTVPPNSQGYLTLASAWIADGLDLPADPDDPLWAHLLVEASRQAAGDRIDVLHEGADGAALVAPERLAPRRDCIDPDHSAPMGGTFSGGGTIYL